MSDRTDDRDSDQRTPAYVGAREVAYEVLTALDEERAFLQPALEAAVQRVNLPGRDRGLALELVMGVTRWQARLDWTLNGLLRDGLESLPPPMHRILRLAVYQLLFLDRVPAHAAVDTAVRLARHHVGEGLAKLTNGVLRNLLRKGERPMEGDGPEAMAMRYSHPEWLVRRWLDELGREGTIMRCEANNRAAPLTIRRDAPGEDRARLQARLEYEGAETREAKYAPDGLHMTGHPRPFASESFGDHWWVAQDEASQLVTLLLDPKPGETVWDVCAAPGGKTRYLARLMRDEGRLLATDVHARKVGRMKVTMRDLQCVQTAVFDARDALEGGSPFDRVLVDAPCTGLGVIRRHPEIKWRRTEADIGVRAEAQRVILANAARGVRPGGVLVYSVCTDTPEEGPQVVDDFMAKHPNFELAPLPEGINWGGVMEGDRLVVRPETHDTDGFFAVRLQRKVQA